ncbi:MAG: DNA polymerase III subunit delta' [Desulfovibrio sp.]|nr:DNA polymerase III subunit delta' [Desulfovibrio sp.]
MSRWAVNGIRPLSAKEKLNKYLPSLSADSLAATIARLEQLSLCPPQVLLFEGATESQRRDLARFWALVTLCPKKENNAPCFECPSCQLILHDEHHDVMAFDGSVSKKDDEEEAFFHTFNAENARSIKARLRDAPSGPYRLVFFTGMAKSKPEAPNALLKILEEPQPSALFVLMVPQRLQILPTLVSRALCLTLPWSDPDAQDEEEVSILLQDFVNFLQDRGDFLGKLANRTYLTEELARQFLVACQKSVTRVLQAKPAASLDIVWAKLAVPSLAQIIFWLNEAATFLRAQVTPARVLTAFCERIYVLLRASR